jgi:hypothetical protein
MIHGPLLAFTKTCEQIIDDCEKQPLNRFRHWHMKEFAAFNVEINTTVKQKNIELPVRICLEVEFL